MQDDESGCLTFVIFTNFMKKLLLFKTVNFVSFCDKRAANSKVNREILD